MKEQTRLIDDALSDADVDTLQRTLVATVADALTICRGAQRQYDRRADPLAESEIDWGKDYVEKHSLLLLAEEAVCHAEWVLRLLNQLGTPESLPLDGDQRKRLREARNLLAEHRDERVIYMRLTGRHTPHVRDVYREVGEEVPARSIDVEQLGGGRLLGNLLSLSRLGDDLGRLEVWLEGLQRRYRREG